jgi:hypothetical protein
MKLALRAMVLLAGCSAGGPPPPTSGDVPRCRTVVECDAHDGDEIEVVGTYRFFPDQPGVDYTGVPRAVRVELDGGAGPLLEPYWHPDAVRSASETERFLGREVRVRGRYLTQQPRNPDDPPQASALGGSCIHPVETIELAD